MKLIPVDGYQEPLVRASDLSLGLEYSRSDSVARLIRQHQEEFEPHEIPMIAENVRQGGKTLFLTEVGAIKVCMLARTEQARRVRKHIAEIYQEYRNHPTRTQQATLTPTQMALESAKQFMQMAQAMADIEGKVQTQATEIDTIKKKLLPEAKITEEQAKNVLEAVRTVGYALGGGRSSYGMVWGELKHTFGFAAYRELPREKYDAVMEYLDSWYRSIIQE